MGMSLKELPVCFMPQTGEATLLILLCDEGKSYHAALAVVPLSDEEGPALRHEHFHTRDWQHTVYHEHDLHRI